MLHHVHEYICELYVFLYSGNVSMHLHSISSAKASDDCLSGVGLLNICTRHCSA